MIIVRIKSWIIHKLAKLIFWMGGHVYIEPYVFFRTAYISIKRIEKDSERNFTREYIGGTKYYNWDLLKNDILKHGIKRNPAIFYTFDGTKNKYYNLIDGNHRLTILKELHGVDYKVKVNLYVPDPFDTFEKMLVKNRYGGRVEAKELNDITYKLKKQFNAE